MERVWEFTTPNFVVALEVSPCEENPRDCFEFPEDVEAVENGTVEWFDAVVAVYGPKGELIGSDSLGACAYETFEDFYASHRTSKEGERNTLANKARKAGYCHCFPGMVREAVANARDHLRKVQALHVRG